MGSMLVYETASSTFTDDLVTGTIASQKCDFSNAAKYGSYITSKTVPVDLPVFVDFEFTTSNPLVSGGKIVVELDGMEKSTGSGTTNGIYVYKGITGTAVWDGTTKVSISGFSSTSAAATVGFRT